MFDEVSWIIELLILAGGAVWLVLRDVIKAKSNRADKKIELESKKIELDEKYVTNKLSVNFDIIDNLVRENIDKSASEIEVVIADCVDKNQMNLIKKQDYISHGLSTYNGTKMLLKILGEK